jgi:hypothetical protein
VDSGFRAYIAGQRVSEVDTVTTYARMPLVIYETEGKCDD